MFTVYLALNESILQDVTAHVRHINEMVFSGSTTDPHVALAECAATPPGVLVLDDSLLAENPALATAFSERPYPVVLFADTAAPNVARRALALKADDLLATVNWQDHLFSTLSRVATPIVGQTRKPGRVISVFSSKGGAGKTTIAVNLAVALGQRVHDPIVLVDMDLAFGDVVAMLGRNPHVTIHDLLSTSLDGTTIQKALIEVATNVWVLPAPLRPEDAEDIQADHIVKILTALKERFSYIVIDMAPGYDELNVTALDMSDTILTVCTPDVVTLRTIGQAIQLFREGFRYAPDKIRLILNRSGSHTGIERQDIEAILKSPVIYELPSDGALPVRAANDGVPLVLKFPSSNLAKAFSRVANTLIKEDRDTRRKRVGGSKRAGRFSLFRK